MPNGRNRSSRTEDVDRSSIWFDADALTRLSREDAQRLEALPTRVEDGRVVVAVAEPTEGRLEALRDLIGDETIMIVVPKSALDAGLRSDLLRSSPNAKGQLAAAVEEAPPAEPPPASSKKERKKADRAPERIRRRIGHRVRHAISGDPRRRMRGDPQLAASVGIRMRKIQRRVRDFLRPGEPLHVRCVAQFERAQHEPRGAKHWLQRVGRQERAHTTNSAMRRTVFTFRMVVAHLSIFSSAAPPNFESL